MTKNTEAFLMMLALGHVAQVARFLDTYPEAVHRRYNPLAARVVTSAVSGLQAPLPATRKIYL